MLVKFGVPKKSICVPVRLSCEKYLIIVIIASPLYTGIKHIPLCTRGGGGLSFSSNLSILVLLIVLSQPFTTYYDKEFI